MAKPKAKSKGVTNKGTRTVRGNKKVSDKKQTEASNPCCPVINTVCRPTYSYRKVEKYVGDEVFHEKERVKGVDKCIVKWGKKERKNLTREEMDKVLNEIGSEYTTKRCIAKVIEKKRKEPEKVAPSSDFVDIPKTMQSRYAD